MVGLVSALVGEIAYEVVRFVIMLALLVLAVFVGGKLRKAADPLQWMLFSGNPLPCSSVPTGTE